MTKGHATITHASPNILCKLVKGHIVSKHSVSHIFSFLNSPAKTAHQQSVTKHCLLLYTSDQRPKIFFQPIHAPVTRAKSQVRLACWTQVFGGKPRFTISPSHMWTEAQKLVRHCEVTAILVLHGLPRYVFIRLCVNCDILFNP